MAARRSIKRSESDDEVTLEDGYDCEPETTLDSIERSKTINFSISANYTSTWKPREAFRELIQNWRDGIIKSFKLAESDFKVERVEQTTGRTTEIIYRVPAPDSLEGTDKKWLGYISYKGRDGEGTIDIVNCAATLQPENLDMGDTSKDKDTTQAGTHGEGLKIALLVFMRSGQNHAVRCRTGGFNWYFNFTTRGRLVARLLRMSSSAVLQAVERTQRQALRPDSLLPLAASPTADVHFVIGETGRGRDEKGDMVARAPVKQEQFEAWTGAALFLHTSDPDGILTADSAGDILLAPELKGKIFFKGLLLAESTVHASASMTGKPLKYGYNIASGSTNRERTHLSNAHDEGKAIMAIWDAVRTKKVKVWGSMATCLSDMLNSEHPEYADVAWAKNMSRSMAVSLKSNLVQGRLMNKWYYCKNEKAQNPRLDDKIRGLGLEGAELGEKYWDVLFSHKLVRGADEEERRRFMAAPVIDIPETPYAKSLCRLLGTCFESCVEMVGLVFVFVQTGQLDLRLSYSEDDLQFRIDDRWLTPQRALDHLDLPASLFSETDLLFHAVKSLFSGALRKLPLHIFANGCQKRSKHAQSQRRKQQICLIEQRLNNFQRLETLIIEGVVGDAACRLQFPAVQTGMGDVEIEIQCHLASTCVHLREKQLYRDVRSSDLPCISQNANGARSPACRFTRYEAWAGQHEENGLTVGQEYFFLCAMVADQDAFVFASHTYSVPTPKRPRKKEVPVSPSPRQPRIELGDALEEMNIINVKRWHSVKRDGQVSEHEVMAILKDKSGPDQRATPRKRVRIL